MIYKESLFPVIDITGNSVRRYAATRYAVTPFVVLRARSPEGALAVRLIPVCTIELIAKSNRKMKMDHF